MAKSLRYDQPGLDRVLMAGLDDSDRLQSDIERAENQLTQAFWDADGEREFNFQRYMKSYEAQTKEAIRGAKEQYIAASSSFAKRSWMGAVRYWKADPICNLFIMNAFMPWKVIQGIFGDSGKVQTYRLGSAAIVFGVGYIAQQLGLNLAEHAEASIPIAIAAGAAGDVILGSMWAPPANKLGSNFDSDILPRHQEYYDKIGAALESKYASLQQDKANLDSL